MSGTRIGMIGHFAKPVVRLDGQTVKTKLLYSELCRHFASDRIIVADTYNWKRRGIFLFFETLAIMVKCRYIIIIVKDKGLRVFLPILFFLNIFLRKPIHHVVLGGDLAETIQANKSLLFYLQAIKANYVETASMKEKLAEMDLKNVFVMPNFKRLPILDERDLKENYSRPFALCTFSRVSLDKGIEVAIEAVKKANELLAASVYTLDIYGQIDEGFKERFQELLATDPVNIQYKGIVPFNDSVSVLQNYFLLLFPTFYKGEGFPGTLIDAFSAGVPVVVSDWKYNGELVEDQADGFIVKANDVDALTAKLVEIAEEPEQIVKMKKKCLDKAWAFHPDLVIREFLIHMGISS